MTDFEIGDVVVLLSGGPKMTVTDSMGVDAITTRWFDGACLKGDSFAAAELELAADPAASLEGKAE